MTDGMTIEALNGLAADRVIDYDLYAPDGIEQGIHAAILRLRDSTPHKLVWTPRHGGHWIVLSGVDVHRLYADHNRLSNEVSVVPPPPNPPPLGALSYNPPDHAEFRALLNRGLGARAIREREADIRALTVDLIEGFRPYGRCDFAAEFASILPLSIFLGMVDIPLTDRAMLQALTHETTHPSASFDANEFLQRFWDYLLPLVRERRAAPRDDMISDIATGVVFGRPLTDDEAVGACMHLMIAGLDTVAAFVSFMMKHLADHPDQRRRLIDRPDEIGPAITEFLRRFPMVTGIRKVAREFDFDGVTLRAGDMIALPTILTNLDGSAYPDPLSVDFARPAGRQATFGNGIHRCPGSPLARLEIRVLLEEWLRRIPDFEVDPDRPVHFAGGYVGTILSLPLRWNVPDVAH